MEFFLDTGVIYGRIDHNDIFNPTCIRFFREYPLNLNYFCTTKYIVEAELSNVRLKRTQGLSKTGREIERRARMLMERINNVEFSSHKKYKPIKIDIHAFLIQKAATQKPKDNDSKLLTHAYLWEFNTSSLRDPYFVTTDSGDIVQNREDIRTIAEKHLCCSTKLVIELVSAIVRS